MLVRMDSMLLGVTSQRNLKHHDRGTEKLNRFTHHSPNACLDRSYLDDRKTETTELF
jgi:hypothetical protein